MSVVVNGVTFTGDPCRVVETTFNGRWVKAGEATMALVFVTDAWLREHHGCHLYVIQSAYNTGVSASAGTHDLDGCLDFYVINRRGRKVWARGSRWLRRLHWFAWWRHTGSWYRPSSWHFHAVRIGVSDQCPVGTYVPGQEADGWAGRTGLAGHLVDPAWRPRKYRRFNFEKWYRKQVEDMGYADWSKADKDAFWADFDARAPRAVWDAPVNATKAGADRYDNLSFRGLAKHVLSNVRGGK